MTDYWIKLYIEILDDPKMATLPDRLWRRVIELFLCAGKLHKNGHLPDTKQLAWMMRVSTDDLDFDLKQIAMTGIIERNDNGWLVSKFETRQAPSPVKERVRQHRERMQKQQYYGDVTDLKRNVTQITDTDTDTETEEERVATPPVYKFSAEKIFCDVTGFATFPGTQQHYQNIIEAMRDTFGVERSTEMLKKHYKIWKNTKRKDGSGNYSGLTLVWIDRAQEELATKPATPKDPSEMSSTELLEKIRADYDEYRKQESGS